MGRYGGNVLSVLDLDKKGYCLKLCHEVIMSLNQRVNQELIIKIKI